MAALSRGCKPRIAGLHVTSRRPFWMTRIKAFLSSGNFTLFSCKFFKNILLYICHPTWPPCRVVANQEYPIVVSVPKAIWYLSVIIAKFVSESNSHSCSYSPTAHNQLNVSNFETLKRKNGGTNNVYYISFNHFAVSCHCEQSNLICKYDEGQ